MDLINFYYNIKPFLPRRLQLALRRKVFKKRLKNAHGTWPISESAGTPPLGWQGWPEGKQFAVIITHDVESSRGLARCQRLAELDQSYGFKSAFNIVPCKYEVPDSIRNWLTDNGFEVGVHDYNHDGKLYKSKEVFDNRAIIINEYIKRWNVIGFRSAAMHHNLEWLSNLDISYDCSTFDTDPFEPQSDGVNTIFPYLYQNEKTGRGFLEIPYTLPQDFTIFIIKQEKNCGIWKDKLRWIAEKGGMVTVIVHPDYINFDTAGKKRFDEYQNELYSEFLFHITNEYKGSFYNPLPGELATFVRNEYKDKNDSLL
ncbi:MAG: hypothetical protein GX640_14300 [Fibrobacter sp.]|nr:hypothetical protein [Fibrobacter sp.]